MQKNTLSRALVLSRFYGLQERIVIPTNGRNLLLRQALG